MVPEPAACMTASLASRHRPPGRQNLQAADDTQDGPAENTRISGPGRSNGWGRCSTGAIRGSTTGAGGAGGSEGGELAPREIADAELGLLSRHTGQPDLQALRRHVIAVWRRAISGPAPVYLCVRGLMFLEPRVQSHPAFQRALSLMRADIGAALGTDVRQLRMEGLQEGEVAALDVEEARHYWDVGLQLYRDASHPPCLALFGDITDDSILPPCPAPGAPLAAVTGMPASGTGSSNGASKGPVETSQQQHSDGQLQPQPQVQRQCGSIAELAGAAHVVSCTAVLHCLGREAVQRLLAKAAVLLRPGGLLLGSTLGADTPREWQAAYQAGCSRWLHSAESLRAALQAAGFEQVEVAPTTWKDVERSRESLRPILDSHVGGQLGMDERHMLAFSAAKPAGQPGAASTELCAHKGKGAAVGAQRAMKSDYHC